MSRKLLIGIVVILLVSIASVYYGYTWLIEAGYPSCAASIEDAISRQLALDRVPVTDEWQILAEEEEQVCLASSGPEV